MRSSQLSQNMSVESVLASVCLVFWVRRGCPASPNPRPLSSEDRAAAAGPPGLAAPLGARAGTGTSPPSPGRCWSPASRGRANASSLPANKRRMPRSSPALDTLPPAAPGGGPWALGGPARAEPSRAPPQPPGQPSPLGPPRR